MTVKVKAIMLIILISLCGRVFAQDKDESQSSLQGLWVLMGMRVKGEVTPQRNHSAFKLISPDNTFMNFMVMPQQSVITAKGTVDVVSDSVFVENVEKSVNSTLNGKTTELAYEVKNKRLLYVKFFIEKSSLGQDINQWYEEVWKLVEMPEQPQDKSGEII